MWSFHFEVTNRMTTLYSTISHQQAAAHGPQCSRGESPFDINVLETKSSIILCRGVLEAIHKTLKSFSNGHQPSSFLVQNHMKMVINRKRLQSGFCYFTVGIHMARGFEEHSPQISFIETIIKLEYKIVHYRILEDLWQFLKIHDRITRFQYILLDTSDTIKCRYQFVYQHYYYNHALKAQH